MPTAKSSLINLVLVAFGALASSGCWNNLDYGNPAFRCSPSQVADACPDDYTCCSDDPAAVGGNLPAFRGETDPKYGMPIFSNNNNPLGTQGMCTDVTEIVNGLPANGCPVPCNPTWAPGDIAVICGGVQCCQTEPLAAEDCIQDPADGNRWRAVRGSDILGGLTTWGSRHATNQDPDAKGCLFFSGQPIDNPVTQDCLAQLSVADQRGFCNTTCPCVEDTCAMLNGEPPKCPFVPGA